MNSVLYKCIVFYTCNLTTSSVKIRINLHPSPNVNITVHKKNFKNFTIRTIFPNMLHKKKTPHHDFLFTPSFYEFYIVSIFWNSFTSHSSRNTLSYLRYSKSSMVPSSPVSLYQLGFALVCVVSFPFCVLL